MHPALIAPPPVAGLIGLSLLLGWWAGVVSRTPGPRFPALPVAVAGALCGVVGWFATGGFSGAAAGALASASAWLCHQLWLGYIPTLIARRAPRAGGASSHAHPRR